MPPNVKLLRRRVVYQGRVLGLHVDRIIEPGGVRATREVVEHVGSVVILPYLPDGRIVLVRQYRHAVRRSLWELVAGSVEPGESLRQAARRELLEETGYIARNLEHVINFFPSPGILSEEMHLVEARDLDRARAQPEEDERIRVGRFSRADLRRLFALRKITDGKTLVGLLWLFGGWHPARRP